MATYKGLGKQQFKMSYVWLKSSNVQMNTVHAPFPAILSHHSETDTQIHREPPITPTKKASSKCYVTVPIDRSSLESSNGWDPGRQPSQATVPASPASESGRIADNNICEKTEKNTASPWTYIRQCIILVPESWGIQGDSGIGGGVRIDWGGRWSW